jgi:hypothetical protein
MLDWQNFPKPEIFRNETAADYAMIFGGKMTINCHFTLQGSGVVTVIIRGSSAQTEMALKPRYFPAPVSSRLNSGQHLG